MRSEQYMGLSDKALDWLKAWKETFGFQTVTVYTTEVFEDGSAKFSQRTEKRTLVSEETYSTVQGAYGGSYELTRYWPPGDNTYVEEFLQTIYWSSGPMYFIGLRWPNGKVVDSTLWSLETMASM